MTHHVLRVPALVLGLGLALGPYVALRAEAPAVDTYTIDSAHSHLGFRVRRLAAKISGRFTDFSGKVHVDTKDISKSSVEVTIQAASINTDNDTRDKHLRSVDFFDVAKYPTLTFKSTGVKEVEKGKLQVTGVLTICGVAKTISFPITNMGTHAGTKAGTVVIGFADGHLSVNRNDFNIKTYRGAIGDEVEIRLDIEAWK